LSSRLDLVGGCGTIRFVRLWWLVILMFAVVAASGSPADAQVFKPRGKSGKTAAKKAPPAEKPAAEKKAAARPSPKKTAKKSRAADAGRPSDLTPTAAKTKKGKRPVEEDDEVASAPSDSGDDDEVIITDDDD
jgi:hypothetical protein